MTYADVAILVFGSGMVAGVLAWATRRLIRVEVLRRHHELGNPVFLQLGLVFAVLLAFVFSEVWGEYNTAADAISRECGELRGIAAVAAMLPAAQRARVETALVGYVSDTIERDWPAMALRRTSDATSRSFRQLWAEVLTLDGAGQIGTLRAQMFDFLREAQHNRETRLFQVDQGVPSILWLLLASMGAALVGFLLCFGIDYLWSQVVFTATFATFVAFVLALVKLLDYPFEGALRLSAGDFVDVLQRVSALTGP